MTGGGDKIGVKNYERGGHYIGVKNYDKGGEALSRSHKIMTGGAIK